MSTGPYDDLPQRMKGLPVDHRGYVVPWFVAWRDGQPVFPAMDHAKLIRAWRSRRCWVCGEPLGQLTTFVVGPMCVVNRISSEPPSHIDCARFSARHCPFLTRPRMGRVPDAKLPAEVCAPAGEMIERNPGVACLWTTRNPRIEQVHNGVLFHIGDPAAIEWWAEGREATRAEILHSIETGIPALQATIQREPPHQRAAAQAELEQGIRKALELVP